MKIWEGFGYYFWACNFYVVVKYIVYMFKGKFFSIYEGIWVFKGVGFYIVVVIVFFVYEFFYVVVDGNVFWVLFRFWGI